MSNNTNPNHIPLTIRDSLNNILTEFYYDISSKSVCITVNHKYQLKTIGIPTDIINQDVSHAWYKFLDLVAKSVRENAAVNDEQDVQEITYAIDDNHELIHKCSTNNRNRKQQQDEDEEEEEDKSIPKILIKLALANSTLFQDEFNEPHALVKIKDYYEALSIAGTKFKRNLSKLYYDSSEGNKIVSTEVLNSVVHHLQADAEFDGKTIPLHLRTAWSNQETKDAIYYDMSDEKRRCIKVTKDGWKIVDNQIEVLFEI